MSDFSNLIRPGQSGGSGDTRALYLKLFSGEVIYWWNRATVMRPLHTVRTISGGKSAQFPVLGGGFTASYHTPGDEIDGQTAVQGEKTINVDNLLIAPVFFPNIDDALSHFDVRQEYAKQAADALAQKFDKNLLQLVLLAARTNTTLTGGPDGLSPYNADGTARSGFGGARTTNIAAAANADSDIVVLKEQIRLILQKMDEQDIPFNERHCILRPAQWYLFFKEYNSTGPAAVPVYNLGHLNRDIGGTGSIASATLPDYLGLTFHKSNNIPSGVVAAATTLGNGEDAELNVYAGTFSKTVCPIFHRSAVGTVKALDLQTETEYSVRHQGTLLVSKYLMGHGILQPGAAAEVAKT